MRNLFDFIADLNYEIYVSNNDLWKEKAQYPFCPEKSNEAIYANFNSVVLTLEFEKERLANHEC